jgi:hypothetical protein
VVVSTALNHRQAHFLIFEAMFKVELNRALLRNALIVLSFTAFAIHTNAQQRDRQMDKAHERSVRFKDDQSLSRHPYTKRLEKLQHEFQRSGKLQATPEQAWMQDFIWTMDPQLKRPTPEVLPGIVESMRSTRAVGMGLPGASASPWIARGPNNVGGRTRALAWDPNDPTRKKAWAGGVTGGLWFNNDVANSNSSWQSVNDFWDALAVTSIAFDPNDPKIMYVGTGEGWQTGSSRGAGIWKSTNAGSSWTRLSSTNTFMYVNDIVVRNENGTSVVYAAVDGNFYMGSWHGEGESGIRRSTNGGTSWSNVSPTVSGQTFRYVAADLEIAADNRLWAGTKSAPYGTTEKGGGRVLTSTNGTTWTVSYSSTATKTGRVAIACALSDSNFIYAMVEHSQKCEEIVRSMDEGATWGARFEPADVDDGIPDDDFTRNQAWYDFVIAVDPNDRARVVAGGIDLFISTNGAGSWTHISKWSNNNNLASLPCSYVHADQHAIVFKQGRSDTVLFGTDGGVFFTGRLASAGSSNVIVERNRNYVTTQFYSAAISPGKGTNNLLGGTQDNGTLKTNAAGSSAATMVTSGDGAYCFIDQTAANTQIASYVYNQYYITTNNWSSSSKFLDEASTGSFINIADYDDVQNVLYSARSEGTIFRTTGLPSSPNTQFFTYATGTPGKISHIKVSPYGGISGTVFIGTETGRVFKMTNSLSGTPTFTNITGGLTTGTGRTISCIEIGGSEDTLLLTYSNYGISNSVLYSTNGGASWANKDNSSLPNMPIRWALFNPVNRTEVILATEVGVWGTENVAASVPSWKAQNLGLANVRVNMLKVRKSDLTVVAATFGRGIFTSDGFNTIPPVADFGLSDSLLCQNQVLRLFDSSENKPSAWTWRFTPGTVDFVNGTDSNSQFPQVRFQNTGTYSIRLTASNSNGINSINLTNVVRVIDTLIPTATITPSRNPVCQGDGVSFTFTATHPGATPSLLWLLNGNSTGNNGNTFNRPTPADGDIIALRLTSSERCASPKTVTSSPVTISIQAKPDAPLISRVGDSIICNSSADSAYWYVDGARIAPKTLRFKAVTGGTYQARIWKNGCLSDLSNSAQWWGMNTQTVSLSGLRVYPNPTQGSDCKVAADAAINSLRLFEMQGREVEMRTERQSATVIRLLLSDLPAAQYMLIVETDLGTESVSIRVTK